jgi:hypothetical protein
VNQPVIDTIAGFLNLVGIGYVMRPINGETFLPGLQLENGKIVIDTEKLLYPGDILHEAGHLAAYTSDIRETIGDPLTVSGGYEMMALAWSYAACLHIGIDPKIVFHEDGYKGESEFLLQEFASGSYIGLNMLQWMGMAYDKKNAQQLNVPPYPHIISWCRKTLID